MKAGPYHIAALAIPLIPGLIWYAFIVKSLTFPPFVFLHTSYNLDTRIADGSIALATYITCYLLTRLLTIKLKN